MLLCYTLPSSRENILVSISRLSPRKAGTILIDCILQLHYIYPTHLYITSKKNAFMFRYLYPLNMLMLTHTTSISLSVRHQHVLATLWPLYFPGPGYLKRLMNSVCVHVRAYIPVMNGIESTPDLSVGAIFTGRGGLNKLS